ncbi:MAG: DUF2461 domain-containing protein [Bacteroidales bacterium]
MQNTIRFLTDLSKNNNRDWFNEHKDNYLKAKEEFELFISRLIQKMATFAPDCAHLLPKDVVFRIYRDTRFSKDKTPYKTHFGAYIAQGGRKGNFAGYYLHLDPKEPFAGGGLYMPPSEQLKRVRQEIAYNFEEFRTIVEAKKFVKQFGSLIDDRLQRPPKGYDADHPAIEYLKYKGFTVVQSLDISIFNSDKPEEQIAMIFRDLAPLVDFLNRALKD